MGKAEKGSAKDLANKMKAKGLQKLKFYCQMCNKQCRDENGFKCHLTSDTHLRNMKLFAENAGDFLDSFSQEFESVYMDTLRRRHGTKRMNANNVYQEVIQDKEHVHMNSTKWATLTDFVQYLGKTGKCVVEETERGWYVTYIERDPALLARQEAHRKRVESERLEEEKMAKRMEKQRAEAAVAVARAGGSVEVAEASKLGERTEEDRPVALTLGGGMVTGADGGAGLAGKKRKKMGSGGTTKKIKSVFGDDDDDDDDESDGEQHKNGNGSAATGSKAAATSVSVSTSAAASETGPATAAAAAAASAASVSSPSSSHRSIASSASGGSNTSQISDKPVKYLQHHSSSSAAKSNKPHVDLLIATAHAACIYDADARRKCREEDAYYRSKAFGSAKDDGSRSTGSSGRSGRKSIDDVRKDYWIRRNIVVRIISKKLSGGKYFKRKGIIVRVIDRYLAEIEILDSTPDARDGGDLIRIDQDDLETVVPKEGKECRILNGRGRGKRAEVISLDKSKYRGTLKILESGEVVEKIHYEDFSKIAPRLDEDSVKSSSNSAK